MKLKKWSLMTTNEKFMLVTASSLVGASLFVLTAGIVSACNRNEKTGNNNNGNNNENNGNNNENNGNNNENNGNNNENNGNNNENNGNNNENNGNNNENNGNNNENSTIKNKLKNELLKITINDFDQKLVDFDQNSSSYKVSKDKFAKLLNVDVKTIKSLKITKGKELEKGFTSLNITLKLSDYEEEIIMQNTETGIYDPQSTYNKKFLTFRDVGINGKLKRNQFGLINNYNSESDWDQSLFETFYLPQSPEENNKKLEITFFGASFWIDYKKYGVIPEFVKKLDFRFTDISDFGERCALRDVSSIEEITFNGNKNWVMRNPTYTNSLRDMKKLRFVDFSNTSIESIPGQLFVGDTNLEEVLFKNCNKLTQIAFDAFQDCNKLTSLDFSDSPNISQVDDSAFWGCTSLKTIYVNNENIKTLFEKSIKAAGLTGCSVIVK